MKRLISFILSSSLSILFIAILVGLLTMAPQGGTLIIDLFRSPIQLLVFLTLFYGFALVLSHYPVYIHEYRRSVFFDERDEKERGAEWLISEPTFLGFGLVNYDEKVKPVGAKLFSLIRKVLGASWIFGFAYVLHRTLSAYQPPHYNEGLLRNYIILFAAYGIVFGCFHYWKKSWRQHHPGHKWLIGFLYAFIALSLIGLSILLYWVGNHHWAAHTFWGLQGLNIIAILTYSLFVQVRHSLVDETFIPLAWLGSDKGFVGYISVLGWISLGVILYGHFNPLSITPILVIQAYFFLFYGIIIVLLKHYFFYTQNNRRNKILVVLWRMIFPGLAVLSPVIIYFIASTDNKLHVLPINCEVSALEDSTYIDNFIRRDPDTIYFISSYGGGLKSNAWNLMLMNSWKDHPCYENILNNTFSMSGVSGGALGQSFFLDIYLKEKWKKKDIIGKLGRSNFLSVDVLYLLGYDLLREPLSFLSSFRPDRAKRSIHEYAAILESPEIEKEGYRSHWEKLYNDGLGKSIHIPALVVNATSTHKTQAVGGSVDWDDIFDQVFPLADNLSNLPMGSCPSGGSISYGHMASCSNRFPIFSPAARIDSTGYFLDGGYFENSGVLSSIHLYEYYKEIDTIKADQSVKFINIINDKSAYISRLIDLSSITKSVAEAGELSAIIGTVTNIEIWPNYIRERQKRILSEEHNISVSSFYLPHRISVKDIEECIKGKVDSSELKLYTDLCKINNRRIDNALFQYLRDTEGLQEMNEIYWKTVEPPLARILTEPAVKYMEAMIYHESIIRTCEGGQSLIYFKE